MNAGRELDARIAEEVMGWTSQDVPMIGHCYVHRFENGITEIIKGFVEGDEGWKPSTLIRDAWVVAERIAKQWPDFGISHGWEKELDGKWTVSWGMDGHGWEFVTADTAPLAICLAALEAVKETT